MTEDQKKQCHAIIHTAAVAAGGGNALPAPGLGIAVDVVAMTTMTMGLAAVFGGDLKEEMAKSVAIAALKNTMLKQPIKTITKEVSKLVPFLGQVVAPTISVAMIEAAGWTIAKDLAKKSNESLA